MKLKGDLSLVLKNTEFTVSIKANVDEVPKELMQLVNLPVEIEIRPLQEKLKV